MRKFLYSTLVATLSIAGLGTSALAQQILNYSEASPNRGVQADAVQWFADQVSERTNGELKINVSWSGALLGAGSTRKGVSDGVADVGSVIGAYTPKEALAMAFTELPIVDPDPWVAATAAYDTIVSTPAIAKSLEDENLVFLSNFTYHPTVMMCNGRSISNLEDLEGVKIRATQFFGKVMDDLDANVVNQSIFKAYQSLDSGLIDCTQGYVSFGKALKLHEVTDTLTVLRWGQAASTAMVMNKSVFDALSPEQQKILKEVGEELVDWYSVMLINEEARTLEQFQNGLDGRTLSVLKLPEGDRERLLELGQEAKDNWVREATEAGFPAEEIVETYLANVAKNSSTRDKDGYPTYD